MNATGPHFLRAAPRRSRPLEAIKVVFALAVIACALGAARRVALGTLAASRSAQCRSFDPALLRTAPLLLELVTLRRT